MAERKKYPSPLNVAEVPPGPIYARGADQISERARREWWIRRVRMYRTLMAHYGISLTAPEVDQWMGLAQALAREHVPYFRIQKSTGKTIWTADVERELMLAVDRIKALEPRKSITRICLQLASTEPWRALLDTRAKSARTPKPGLALKFHYEKAKRRTRGGEDTK
jgi:hypothetical protein